MLDHLEDLIDVTPVTLDELDVPLVNEEDEG